MESALNLPPAGFINVSKRPMLMSLNINLLAADSARPPLQPPPGSSSRLGEIKRVFCIYPPPSVGFALAKPMERRERADAPEHITACCQCFAS